MTKVNDLLNSRFKSQESLPSKMKDLGALSAAGALSSFAGIFRVNPLSKQEEEELRLLLETYKAHDHSSINKDLSLLINLTSEVKAISNQAAILHGERIQKAQNILKGYKEGAFTAWLLRTYRNRQTPYNFLHYFLLYTALSPLLQKKMDQMPRQALYVLAARGCSQKEKEALINHYQGETKEQLLSFIREKFPLPPKDRRTPSFAQKIILSLKEVQEKLENTQIPLSLVQKKKIREVLQSIRKAL